MGWANWTLLNRRINRQRPARLPVWVSFSRVKWSRTHQEVDGKNSKQSEKMCWIFFWSMPRVCDKCLLVLSRQTSNDDWRRGKGEVESSRSFSIVWSRIQKSLLKSALPWTIKRRFPLTTLQSQAYPREWRLHCHVLNVEEQSRMMIQLDATIAAEPTAWSVQDQTG